MLDVDDIFWREEDLCSVQMGGEFNTLFPDSDKRREAVDLKTAAVRKDGSFPGDEGMNSAEFFYGFKAGPQIEMIGIDEKHLGSQALQMGVEKPFDCALAAHRSKGRRFDFAVGGVDDSCAGRGVRIFGCDLKTLFHLLPHYYIMEIFGMDKAIIEDLAYPKRLSMVSDRVGRGRLFERSEFRSRREAC